MQYERLYADIMLRLKQGLRPSLYYHGIHHTIDVLSAISQICKAENVAGDDLILLKTASLLHDSGFMVQDVGHEDAGCTISRETLPGYDYSPEQIDIVCGMIMATKIPQSPKTKLEEIICDADLDYLGRNDFYPIAKSLYKELLERGAQIDETEWNKNQIKFLSAHHYFTSFAQTHREANKQQRIAELKKVVGD